MNIKTETLCFNCSNLNLKAYIGNYENINGFFKAKCSKIISLNEFSNSDILIEIISSLKKITNDSTIHFSSSIIKGFKGREKSDYIKECPYYEYDKYKLEEFKKYVKENFNFYIEEY